MILEIQMGDKEQGGDGCQHWGLVLSCASILASHNLFQIVNGDTKWIALKCKYHTIPLASPLATSDDDDDDGNSNIIT